MGLRSMRYYFKQAFSSFWHNGLMTLASVITVTGCLFIFAAFLLFSVNAEYVGKQIQSQCEIQAYVDISCSVTEAKEAFAVIQGLPYVDNATLETKDMALENYKEFLGEDAIALEGLENEDFLRHSIKISMTDLSHAEDLVRSLEKVENIAEVRNQQDLVNKVVHFTDLVTKGTLAVMILLALISVFIISNTIKLAVHARSQEIHIMKFVGATDRFIRWPFVIEGVLVGIIGSIVALLVSCFGYQSLVNMFMNTLDIFQLYSIFSILWYIIGAVAVLGIVIGAVGSAIAVRRYLKV